MIKSLRLRISLYLTIAVFTISVGTIFITWSNTKQEIGEVYDKQLIYFAETLSSTQFANMGTHAILNLYRKQTFERLAQILNDSFDYFNSENKNRSVNFGGFQQGNLRVENEALAFAIFDRFGNRIFSDSDYGDQFDFLPVQGFTDIDLRNHHKWRVFWLYKADSDGIFIAVGQEIQYRNRLVQEIVLKQMWLWFLGLPILLVLILLIVNYELNYFKVLNRKIKHLNPDSRSKLVLPRTPTEIQPLIDSLNHYLIASADVLHRERRFTSDAAHEIRTPLAGLRIQAEIAIMEQDSYVRNKYLNNLLSGVDRATKLINQLLTLSRLDSFNELEEIAEINWKEIVEQLISEREIITKERNIILSYREDSVPAKQLGQVTLLSTLMRNLIDNAINYGPDGNIIEVILGKKSISVADKGPGVGQEFIARLGERFFRPAGQNEKGSGLGLSIVKRIASLHNFEIVLSNRDPHGLLVTVKFLDKTRKR